MPLSADAGAVRRVGEGLLDCTLPRREWTHEEHLAAIAASRRRSRLPDPRGDLRLQRSNRRSERRSAGLSPYDHTISLTYLAGIRAFFSGRSREPLVDAINTMLATDVGRRDWPLRSYSPERLFSVPARRAFVSPDLAPLPG